ncbi:hypothetical protein AVEN_124848-1 [Araneus ventricosus]|uniref:Innexin n=1 Tax=Araneus ventricosus TaxID=182803 RepID=A0A4Y2T4H6_ARAVE|nr:hypothetical protein AVEN_124848-1 [Araneus ventricosus]
MFNVLKGISELAKLNSVRTGYETFRLHYTFTVVILLTFSVVVTSTQIVGSPITCDYNREERMKKLMNTYCWIHSTFLNPGAFNKSLEVSEELGIAQSVISRLWQRFQDDGNVSRCYSTGRSRVTTPNEDRYWQLLPKETDGAQHQTCLVSSLQLPVRQFQGRPCTDA